MWLILFIVHLCQVPGPLNGGRWRLVGEFTEVESGKRNDRPELEEALAASKNHKAKLVIAKLDRLVDGRSANLHGASQGLFHNA